MALVVALVQQYISPVVVRKYTVPTPPEGLVVAVGSEVLLVISSAVAGVGPTVVQTFALLVASVQVNILPVVVLRITVPAPPAGLVDAVGSEDCDSTTFEVFP